MIDSFTGEHFFLSNFYEAEIVFYTERYPTVEHAYQAAKTEDPRWKQSIKWAASPGASKKLGRMCPLVPDWEQIKDDVMYELVWRKFTQHKDLREKLCATGRETLVEGNWWGDTYWGVCRGKGQNRLGQILMTVREDLCS